MTPAVIGSGFVRTGTMTTKDALGILGFGPTHHMIEVLSNPDQLALWKAYFAGQTVDWSAVFDGYVSQVNWPGAGVWEQTLAARPQAKVVHTERPEDGWWARFNKTIGKLFRLAETLPLPDCLMDLTLTMRDGLIAKALGGFHRPRFCDQGVPRQ